MKSFLKLMGAATACAFALGGCAYHYGPQDYRGYEAQGEQAVRFGVVETVREVRIQPGQSGAAAFGGAALGSIAGSNVGGGSGQAAVRIAGMILGGLRRRASSAAPTSARDWEVTVLLDSASTSRLVQAADDLPQRRPSAHPLGSRYHARHALACRRRPLGTGSRAGCAWPRTAPWAPSSALRLPAGGSAKRRGGVKGWSA